MWRPGQRASVLMALLFCFLLSFERNPVADKAPGPEWDGNGILVPKNGQRYQPNQDFRIVFDGSRAMQSASYSSAWSWSMWVNDLKQATISLTPTAPKVDFKIKGPPPGRYAIFFKLHAGEHGEVEGQRVVFFVGVVACPFVGIVGFCGAAAARRGSWIAQYVAQHVPGRRSRQLLRCRPVVRRFRRVSEERC